MTDFNTIETASSKSVAFIAYTVQETARGKFWTRIGIVSHHADGNGFNVLLNAHPIDGQIVVRKPREQAETVDLEMAA